MKSWDGDDTITRDGLVLHGVGNKENLYSGRCRSILQLLRYTRHLLPALRQFSGDLLEIQNFPYFPLLISPFAHRNIPRVYTWHEYWGSYWYEYLGPAGWIGRLIEWIALCMSHPLIAVSAHTGSALRHAGYKDEIPIVPNGIDYAAIRAIPRIAKEYDILFLGRFIPEKHPGLVVDAVSRLVRIKPDLRCLMIGDGPERPAVLRKITGAGLTGTVDCPGFLTDQEEIIASMKSSRVFVLPSEREGFGIAAVEAIACGCIVITLDHPRNAARDHILPGCGFLTPPDPSRLAGIILQALDMTPDQTAMDAYAAEHDWDRIVDLLESRYRILTEDHLPS